MYGKAGFAIAISAVAVAGTAAVVGWQNTAHSMPTSTTNPAATAATQTLRPDFYGVNYDLATASLFPSDTKADPLIASLNPGTIRWPGGTEADFYDWQTGTVPSSKFVFTLTDLYHAWKATGAVPMFDLNVLTPSNQRDTTNQIGMLTAAQKMGLPIKYVELGNELYFPGPGGAFQSGFHNGSDYGATVAIYVRALHRQFPGVEVAADGCLHPDPNTTRETTWNADMLAAATGTGSPDSVILHDYPGPPFKTFTSADLSQLFEAPYGAVSDITAAAKTLQDKPIWLTEYNLRPWIDDKNHANAAAVVYAHELFLAELGLMLPRAEHVALVDNWSALGKSEVLGDRAYPPAGTLTPGGQAVQLVDTAGNHATSTRPITIPDAPKLSDGQPAVIGQAFLTPGSAPRAVLVNLTDHSITVPADPDLPAGTRYQQATGTPTQQQTAAGSLTPGTITPNGLTLAPYSVTLSGATIT